MTSAGGPRPARVLLLGGTAQARALAARLHPRVAVVSSLAGRVSAPRRPVGQVRVGGFGGVDGLAECLAGFDVLVDATHPFAERISHNAARAAERVGAPMVALRRPGWTPGPGDDWRWVPDVPAAARAVDELASRVFVTTGRGGLAAFADVAAWCLIRCVERPDPPLPRRHALLLDRGPFTVDGERELLHAHDIGALVTKDSGGEHTAAKLTATREAGIPVVMVARPEVPDVPVVASVDEAVAWVSERLGLG